MKKNKVLVILVMLSMLACALPGLSQQPVQVSDPNALSTMIAGTAQVLAQQTTNAYLVSTEAPTSTPTSIPTPSNTPTPQISAEGTSLNKQGDGSVIFTDYTGGYSFTFPPGWLPVRINEQEFINAWALPEAIDPKVQSFLTQIQKSDPKVFRLYGLDLQSEHLHSNFLTNFNVLWDRTANDPLEKTVKTLEKELPKSLLNSEILDTNVGVTSSQIPMGILEAKSSLPLTTGQTLELYQKQYLYRLNEGTVVLTVSTTFDLKDAIISGLNQTADQVQMLR